MLRRPPRSTRTDTSFPTRRSSDLHDCHQTLVFLHDQSPLDFREWLTGISNLSAMRTRSASDARSEEHTSELQSLMRISYAVFCLKKKTYNIENTNHKKKKTQRYPLHDSGK